MVKVSIDRDVCQGHARCWEVCPDVFDLDREGYAVVTRPEVNGDLEGEVAEAAANCPEGAITVE